MTLIAHERCDRRCLLPDEAFHSKYHIPEQPLVPICCPENVDTLNVFIATDVLFMVQFHTLHMLIAFCLFPLLEIDIK